MKNRKQLFDNKAQLTEFLIVIAVTVRNGFTFDKEGELFCVFKVLFFGKILLAVSSQLRPAAA